MAHTSRHALITGSSRGIGRGIALKLAESGVRVAIHYYQNEAAALDTLAQVRKCGSDGLIVQADVLQPDQITRMFRSVKEQFGTLDIFVSNARPEVPPSIRRRKPFSSAPARRFPSWVPAGESSPSPTPKAAARAACSPGWAWGPPRPPWNRSSATLP
ncbi:MAG: SDR family NAD(P)-dependent oxidoreductase [Actinobacteria bacterium]|nr:MAG: SDR family NAD(P)-dependent oxidoreductase [Actinomycetota bacterium]